MENSNNQIIAESAVYVCINSYNKLKSDQQNAFNAHIRRTNNVIKNYSKAGITIDDIKTTVIKTVTDKELAMAICKSINQTI